MLQNAQSKDREALAPGAHFGELKSIHQMGSLIVAESHYSPSFQTPFHFHETASFTSVFGGGYTEEFPRKQFVCNFGNILYRPAGEIHRDRIGNIGAHCLMVEMPKSWLQSLASAGGIITRPRQMPNQIDFPSRIRRELRLADDFSPLAIEALVMELACEMQRATSVDKRPPVWLRKVRERVNDEFTNLPRLETLATDAKVHIGHMARAFRLHFGCTIGEYARRRKIEFCCQHLSEEPLSLCDLAAKAGFSSQAHFTRLFKARTGMTPAEFRRSKTRRCDFSTKM
jgi:AraC family transcriptional regulator